MQKHILSLDASNNEDFDKEWLVEAKHRAEDIDADLVQPIGTEETSLMR